METFKKDVISSLAREICQNSIDAKDENSTNPVKIVFHSFNIDRRDIPGVDDISSQIDGCIATWGGNTKIIKQLSEMKSQISQSNILCLRISDFNTTGLIGINSNDDKCAWHYLVHGSGISNKSSTSGGSKGIGKFATFVASNFNTVFYSTKTVSGEYGYEGICKLCSATIPGSEEKTQGIGYYGDTDRNFPIKEYFKLDKEFNRTSPGSDIFILGFKNLDNWKRDIITKILDSFMSAICFGTLEVQVDDIIINKTTLKSIVYDDNLISNNKKLRSGIICQYLLLTETSQNKNFYQDTITIDGYGKVDFRLLTFENDKEDLATYNCVMIRYPYMKIKDLTNISSLPCCAMCIIGDNKLNQVFRDVENPQHTDWEFNRIEDNSIKSEIKGLYKELRDKISKAILGHLKNTDKTETDLEGAGEFLPSVNTGNDLAKQPQRRIIDKPQIRKKKIKNKTININASIPEENGDGVSLDIGDTNEGENDILTPFDSRNEGKDGPVKPGPNQSVGNNNPTGNVIIRPAELRGMRYRLICLNRKNGLYLVTFTSDYDESLVSLEIYGLDDGGNKYPIKILNCSINGALSNVKDNKSVEFSIKHGQKINIEMKTDQDDFFSAEVKVYAYR